MKKFSKIIKTLFIFLLLLIVAKNTIFLVQPIFFGIENNTVKVMYLIEILPLILLYILLPTITIYTIILNKKISNVLILIFILISGIHFVYTNVISSNNRDEKCIKIVKSGPSSQNQDTSTKKYINVTLKNSCEAKESISRLKAVPYKINGDKKPLEGSIIIDKVISIDPKQESSFDIDFTLDTNNENQRIYYLIEIVE